MFATMTKRSVSVMAAAAAAVLLAACSGGTSSPESAAKTFVEKSYAGDADAVVSMIYLSEEDRKQEGIEDVVRGKMKDAVAKQKTYAEQHGGLDSVEVKETAPNSKDAKRVDVDLEIKFKDNETRQDSLKVIETADGWKIAI